jgi:hypothetical protein
MLASWPVADLLQGSGERDLSFSFDVIFVLAAADVVRGAPI